MMIYLYIIAGLFFFIWGISFIVRGYQDLGDQMTIVPISDPNDLKQFKEIYNSDVVVEGPQLKEALWKDPPNISQEKQPVNIED
ncbi:MAG: hypothetical protein KC713_09440, partial [Candidatus Omnitrophica bacterium]|nr:hypothetical protein [Candidatus Omnitrophota bacterium]